MAPMDTPATQSWTKSVTTLERARRYLQGRTLYGPPSMPTVLATTDFWSLTSTMKLGRSRLPFSFTYTSIRRPGSSLVLKRLLCRQARTLAWSQLPTRCTAAFSMCTPMYPLNALWSGTRLYFSWNRRFMRSEEHTSELQSPCNLVCRLLLEKKNREREKT